MFQSNSLERNLRHIYFDESGVGQEPHLVVAGVMMHVDDQYRNLQKYILDMADNLVGERPLDFSFHAKELWHGGKFFKREEWSREKRLEILGHLADVPEKYQFQILYACLERAEYPPEDPENRKSRLRALKKCHALCFLSCLSQTNRFMKEFHQGEMAFAVVEDHADHRSILRDTANLLGDPRLAPAIENDPNISWEPFTHLVEEPLFQKKSGSSPLQIADVCAFILRRHFAGDQYIVPFIERIKPRLVAGLRTKFFEKKAEKAAPDD
ncbi:MAG: DUF3800 domain-containing protein [Rhodospirillales bacterium]